MKNNQMLYLKISCFGGGIFFDKACFRNGIIKILSGRIILELSIDGIIKILSGGIILERSIY